MIYKLTLLQEIFNTGAIFSMESIIIKINHQPNFVCALMFLNSLRNIDYWSELSKWKKKYGLNWSKNVNINKRVNNSI